MTAQDHITCIEHWARADRGPRGNELRAAAAFIADQEKAKNAAIALLAELIDEKLARVDAFLKND